VSATTYWPSPDEVVVTTRRHPHRVPEEPPAGGPRKPLYLDGRVQPIAVRARGPALEVTRNAHRFGFPLARLARIIASGRVNWDGAALALCLASRIPVVFTDGRGRPSGAAMPLVGRTSALDDLLIESLDGLHWRARYDNWLRAQRLRVLRRWRRRRAVDGRPIGEGEWNDAVRAFVYRDDPELGGACAGGCYALVLAMLLRAGVRTQYRACDGGVLALAADLSRIVDAGTALDLGTLAHAFATERHLATRAAEARAVEVENLVAGLLGRLRRNLAEWMEPWP
jgi:hypothetical protein